MDKGQVGRPGGLSSCGSIRQAVSTLRASIPDAGHCAYCHRKMRPRATDKSKGRAFLSATRDHVEPRSRGGRIMVPCCRKCNTLKADMSFDKWLRVMATVPRWWTYGQRSDLMRAAAKAMETREGRDAEQARGDSLTARSQSDLPDQSTRETGE